MHPLFRLLALSLLLSVTSPVAANEKIGKDDLDAQKELLQLKIDDGRELVQKDFESLKTRIDALDKRIEDQNNRVGDIGQSVDRFAVIVSVGGLMVTVLLAFGGLVGYFSVARKAAEEAKLASQKWFDDNQQRLAGQIRELEKAAEHAHQKIDNSVNDVEQYSNAAMKQIQKGLNAPNEQAQPISAIEQQALQQSAEKIREKPEASYSFDDWNKRAFDAYRSGQYEDAALYWKHASGIPNAGAANTAQALFNRAVILDQLKRLEEAFTTYDQLIATYSPGDTPAIREQVAKAMLNRGVTLKQMGKVDKAIANYEQLIATYSPDNTPSIREQVAKAMLNKATALQQMEKLEETIATFDQLIAAYSSDNTPAIREQVAKAMSYKGLTFGLMDKPAEAIAMYEQVIATYSPDSAPAVREQAGKAMLAKGIMLGQMQKPAEAIAIYEQMIATYSPDNTPAIRELVVSAMLYKGTSLKALERLEETIATFDQLIAAYSSDSTLAIREQVARAMYYKGLAIGLMERPAEAIAIYEQMIATYSPDNAPAIRELVADALNSKGFVSLMEAKKAWEDSDQAMVLLRNARTDLQASLDLRAECGMTRGNLAYVLWLLGDRQSSEETFRAALASAQKGGQELRDGTLDDIARHTISEDDAFHGMVERLWSEYQATKSNLD